MTSIQELYGELWAEKSALELELERSLEPRGTECRGNARCLGGISIRQTEKREFSR